MRREYDERASTRPRRDAEDQGVEHVGPAAQHLASTRPRRDAEDQGESDE